MTTAARRQSGFRDHGCWRVEGEKGEGAQIEKQPSLTVITDIATVLRP